MSFLGFGKQDEYQTRVSQHKKEKSALAKIQKKKERYLQKETQKLTAERKRKEELGKLKGKTEVYTARAKYKRAKRAASHPYEKQSLKLSELSKKAGKSGKMRLL